MKIISSRKATLGTALALALLASTATAGEFEFKGLGSGLIAKRAL